MTKSTPNYHDSPVSAHYAINAVENCSLKVDITFSWLVHKIADKSSFSFERPRRSEGSSVSSRCLHIFSDSTTNYSAIKNSFATSGYLLMKKKALKVCS